MAGTQSNSKSNGSGNNDAATTNAQLVTTLQNMAPGSIPSGFSFIFLWIITKFLSHAVPAFRFARFTDVAAVQDQPVVGVA